MGEKPLFLVDYPQHFQCIVNVPTVNPDELHLFLLCIFVPVNIFWHGQGLAIPLHLGLFSVCTLLSKCLFFYLFMHFFSCQMALLLWQMLWPRAWSLSLVCPDFVGYTAFVSCVLLLLEWAFRKVWETSFYVCELKEIVCCTILLLIVKTKFRGSYLGDFEGDL